MKLDTKRSGLLAGAVTIVLAAAAQFFEIPSSGAQKQADETADFDFYVLALSWSPSYCAAQGDRANRQQCGLDKAYSFVVHGLWPQYQKGYPANCETRFGDRVNNTLLGSMADIMPSDGLIRHQWRKHGSCSGLNQEDYFRKTRAARKSINIPKQFQSLDQTKMVGPDTVEQAFLDANPAIRAAGIAVTCDNRRLREVRICLSKNLKPTQCSQVDRRSCKRNRIAMPPLRKFN